MNILFVCNTDGHDPKERTTRPTGGILNSLTLIPEYLAKKGHNVYVRSTYNKDEEINGVHYITATQPIPKWNVLVCNRNVLPKDLILYSKQLGAKVVWWLHDIVQLTYLTDDAFMMLDHVVALSEYCKETYADFYGLDRTKISVIPNGVDTALFTPGDYSKRDPNLFVTASALVKGTMPLHSTLMNLKRVNPDIDFRVYSSQKLHGMANSGTQEEFLRKMEADNAHVYHPVSQTVLSHILKKAWCLLMPNSYPEICSNLLLQARASGCPVLTSDIGANPEFIENRKTGLMTTKYKPHDYYSWIVEYTNLALEIYGNKELHKTISENAPQGIQDWDKVGEAWENVLNRIVGELEVSTENKEEQSTTVA